ncbi:Acetylxylan esterase [Symbiodinium microadriaticum]|uniref:Acetylxylan esterase n=1 Tax=Symbiodinium microadriaticum TaxID=2951 RepID=A0A1Q9CTQ5_SYMMI|nr:Acetylxylan esterase [Symbiodinium microadriaticum]
MVRWETPGPPGVALAILGTGIGLGYALARLASPKIADIEAEAEEVPVSVPIRLWQYLLRRLLLRSADVKQDDETLGDSREDRNQKPPQPRRYALRPEADPRLDEAMCVRYDPPAERKTGAIVIVIPGGNYDESDIFCGEGQPIAQWLAQHGATAVVLQYRCVSRGHYWPAQFQDWLDCAMLVKRKAHGWGCDASRVAVIGFSAGGHLASYAALRSPEHLAPKLQILVYPAIDTRTPHEDGSIDPWYADAGYPPVEASTHLLVTAAAPPAFLAGIRGDSYCPASENTDVYAQALEKCGVSFKYILTEDEHEHGCGLHSWWQTPCEEWLRERGRSLRAAKHGQAGLQPQASLVLGRKWQRVSRAWKAQIQELLGVTGKWFACFLVVALAQNLKGSVDVVSAVTDLGDDSTAAAPTELHHDEAESKLHPPTTPQALAAFVLVIALAPQQPLQIARKPLGPEVQVFLIPGIGLIVMKKGKDNGWEGAFGFICCIITLVWVGGSSSSLLVAPKVIGLQLRRFGSAQNPPPAFEEPGSPRSREMQIPSMLRCLAVAFAFVVVGAQNLKGSVDVASVQDDAPVASDVAAPTDLHHDEAESKLHPPTTPQALAAFVLVFVIPGVGLLVMKKGKDNGWEGAFGFICCIITLVWARSTRPSSPSPLDGADGACEHDHDECSIDFIKDLPGEPEVSGDTLRQAVQDQVNCASPAPPTLDQSRELAKASGRPACPCEWKDLVLAGKPLEAAVFLCPGWKHGQTFTASQDPDRIELSWEPPRSAEPPQEGIPAEVGAEKQELPVSGNRRTFARVVHNVLDEDDCADLIHCINQKGNGRQRFEPDVRNGHRAIVDSQELSSYLLEMLRPHLPEMLEGSKGRSSSGSSGGVENSASDYLIGSRLVDLNERCRVLCYTPGQEFAPHYDGCFVRPKGSRNEGDESMVTVQLYLHDVPAALLSFDFYSALEFRKVLAVPLPFYSEGEELVQRNLLHEGSLVTSGLKYTLRTEAMLAAGNDHFLTGPVRRSRIPALSGFKHDAPGGWEDDEPRILEEGPGGGCERNWTSHLATLGDTRFRGCALMCESL